MKVAEKESVSLVVFVTIEHHLNALVVHKEHEEETQDNIPPPSNSKQSNTNGDDGEEGVPNGSKKRQDHEIGSNLNPRHFREHFISFDRTRSIE